MIRGMRWRLIGESAARRSDLQARPRRRRATRGRAEPDFSRIHFAISVQRVDAGDEDDRVGAIAGVAERGESRQMDEEMVESPGEQPCSRSAA